MGRLTPESIPAGHDICKEGDDADCLWLLQEGEQQDSSSQGSTSHSAAHLCLRDAHSLCGSKRQLGAAVFEGDGSNLCI